jgi:hypothetical protein
MSERHYAIFLLNTAYLVSIGSPSTCLILFFRQRQLSPELPVLDLTRGLHTTVQKEEQDRSADRPRENGLLHVDVGNLKAKDEVKVGKDGHLTENGAEEAVESPLHAG